MIDGSVKKSIARLHPIRDIKYPNENDPRTAPKQLILLKKFTIHKMKKLKSN